MAEVVAERERGRCRVPDDTLLLPGPGELAAVTDVSGMKDAGWARRDTLKEAPRLRGSWRWPLGATCGGRGGDQPVGSTLGLEATKWTVCVFSLQTGRVFLVR